MLVTDVIRLKIDWDDKSDKSTLEDFANKAVSHQLITPFLVLGIGYILTLFM